ncbi:methylglyoxal synthase [uncultured Desulfuromonas sp.]|uniref:methylglyoxal synthase n=1 Tax=uncultured Desulfuromonas sp. TaxID=181013 RepID=UPI00262F1591|nr:methylglyoxal synthase [uncultured Desulfuromonas sp.]
MSTAAGQKRIALIAHDNQKPQLLDWAKAHRNLLARHRLWGTETTGNLLAKRLRLDVSKVGSGPLGGDLEIGAMIARGEIDILVFFWDPLEAQPHDPDVRALLRVAAVWNVPTAGNRSTADLMFSSPLLEKELHRKVPDYSRYRWEDVDPDEVLEHD